MFNVNNSEGKTNS